MATARDRSAWIQILELYHTEYPYLWDKSHKMYSNKNMRNDAYKELTQIYKEKFDIDASVDALKKKLENMRTTYFRELKKVKESIRSGADEVYEPSLWYFEQLNFLASLYEPNGRYYKSHPPTAKDPLKTEQPFGDTSNDSDYEPTTSQENTNRRTDYKKKLKTTVFKKHEYESPISKDVVMKCDDWEVMGRSIGLQLRDIDQKQLIIASKLISDTIYFAKFNRLSEESRVDIGSSMATFSLCSMCAAQVGD